MKTISMTLSALVVASLLFGTAACGGAGGGSGCGAPAEDSSSDYQMPTATQCQSGYVAQGNRCVRIRNTNGEGGAATGRGTASTLSTSGN